MRFDALLDGSSYTPNAYSVDVQRSINWYAEAVERSRGQYSSKSPFALLRTPGRKLFCDPGLGPGTVYGMYSIDNHLYATVNGRFIQVNENGVPTIYPQQIAIDGRPTRFAGNTAAGQIFFTSGGTGYIAASGVVTPVAQLTVPVRWAACIDGYFLTVRDGTQQFQNSDANDGTSWNALNTASASATASAIFSAGQVGNEWYTFSTINMQVFDDSGSVYAPFVPNQNIVSPRGVWAPDSLTNVGGEWYFLEGNNKPGMVMHISGYQALRVSDNGIEDVIRRMSNGGSDCIGWTYEENGHIFYVMYFPVANQTLVFDVSTNKWHERSWTQPNNSQAAHWGYCSASCFGKILVGSRIDGKIYELSMNYLDDSGTNIVRTRITPCIDEEMMNIIHGNLVIDGNMGLGTPGTVVDDQMYDPAMCLMLSNDGGKNWSSEHWRGFGQTGQYTRRAIWRRLGYARRRVYKLITSAPADWGMSGAYVNMNLAKAGGK